jgi:hypothetical protein
VRAFRSTIRKAELQAASHAGRPKKSGGQLQFSAGNLRDSPVPFCALLCSTIATAVQPTGLDQFVANGIRQLQNPLTTETRNCPAGSPLQGECRRFDPVSTHHSS